MTRRFWLFLKKYWFALTMAVTCVVFETMFELVIPLVMANILDVGVANGDKAYILQQGVLMAGCALVALILGIGSAKFAAVCGQGFGAEIRKAEYAKIQSFSFANTDHFTTSSLVTRLTSDVTTIQNAVSTGLRPACRAPVMMLTSLVVAFAINARLALVFLVAAPALGVLLFLIIRRVRPMFGKMQASIDQVNRIVRENLTAIRVVKSFARGDYETEKFSQVNQELRTASERAMRIAVLNMPAMQLVMYITILCILWLGGGQIALGNMKVGELTGFLSYVLQVLNSLMMISSVFLMLTRALTSARRIDQVLLEEIDITDGLAQDVLVQRGDIDFDHVYFKYSPQAREYALAGIDLHIKAGQTVGIIGETGAAKSTLVQLIPRLYDATEGQLRVDGHPVGQYPLAHLHDAVAMVLQKNTLFSGTVRENLLWGNEHATPAEIQQACQIACVEEFLDRLEKGLDTDLGQGGVNVSGGQKQRLCIARAILKKPKVLILDDSTSAVDTATEAKIRAGLAQCLPDTTKIIVAQRITSVLHADQIVILSGGRIEAVGTHWQLLEQNAFYQELYRSQQEGAGL